MDGQKGEAVTRYDTDRIAKTLDEVKTKNKNENKIKLILKLNNLKKK